MSCSLAGSRWATAVAPTVEEPGELNRRGGIVDIFPPGDELPLRIEFFGDEVDSLRRFDPITQRSEAQVREAIIGPPTRSRSGTRMRALERLRRLDAGGLRREALDEWQAAQERLAQGERFEGRALFAPFFRSDEDLRRRVRPRSSSSLSAGRHAAGLQRDATAGPADRRADHHAEERRERHTESGELPPGFPRPYLLWAELLDQIGALSFANLSEPGHWTLAYALSAAPRRHPSPTSRCPTTLFAPADLFGGQLKRLVDDIVGRLRDGERVVVVTPQAARIQELIDEAWPTTEKGRRGEGEKGRTSHRRRATDATRNTQHATRNTQHPTWLRSVSWRCMARSTRAGARPT